MWNYKQYAQQTKQNIYFVTPLTDNAVYEQLIETGMPDNCSGNYIKDEKIQISYKDESGQQQFLTNIFEMTARKPDCSARCAGR